MRLNSSPSSRRAWVEIIGRLHISPVLYVALLAEGVGRNNAGIYFFGKYSVALLAEGVGRNPALCPQRVGVNQVALLAEGVGRNCGWMDMLTSTPRSPSSRRAWVEIVSPIIGSGKTKVALLAEGVGRNPPTGICTTP